MKTISVYAIPLLVCIIICSGIRKRINIFDTFTTGAKDGFFAVFSIATPLIGLMAAIGVLRASGTMDLISRLLSPVTNLLNIPSELLSFALLRPVSGSGSLALANDIFSAEGADSFVSNAVSVMMGSTETTFYVLAIYFGAVGVKKTRYAPLCSLTADFVSFIASIIAARMFLG
jgi:spore maturation protein B